MSNPEPGHSTEVVAFDFAAMEQRIIASYHESIKHEVSEALKPLESHIDELLLIKSKTDKISGEMKKLKLENKTIERRCNLVERKNKDRLNSIENKMLECHVIMHGVEEVEEENSDQRMDKIKEMLSYTVNKPTPEEQLNVASNIPIVSTERLGCYNENRNRPISITFENKSDSDLLLKRKKKLPDGIFVDREYCSKTEKERQFLRPVLKEARKSEEYHGKCKMEGSTLVLQGKKFTHDNIHQLPEKLSGFNCTSKSNKDTICYFGELNPFSNFHPCTFEVAGVRYSTSEQFIQHTKAWFFEDAKTASAIMNAITPHQCKQLSKNITGYDAAAWSKMAKVLCKPGIQAKFFQNPELAKMFEITGNKLLVEACYEKLWGTGIPLHHPKCLDQSLWTNPGIMSEMLGEIRDEPNGIRGDNATDSGPEMDVGT